MTSQYARQYKLWVNANIGLCIKNASLNLRPAADMRALYLESSELNTTEMLLDAGLSAEKLHMPNMDECEFKRISTLLPRSQVKLESFNNMLRVLPYKVDVVFADYTCTPFGNKDVNPFADMKMMFERQIPHDSAILTTTFSRRKHGADAELMRFQWRIRELAAQNLYTLQEVHNSSYGGGGASACMWYHVYHVTRCAQQHVDFLQSLTFDAYRERTDVQLPAPGGSPQYRGARDVSDDDAVAEIDDGVTEIDADDGVTEIDDGATTADEDEEMDVCAFRINGIDVVRYGDRPSDGAELVGRDIFLKYFDDVMAGSTVWERATVLSYAKSAHTFRVRYHSDERVTRIVLKKAHYNTSADAHVDKHTKPWCIVV